MKFVQLFILKTIKLKDISFGILLLLITYSCSEKRKKETTTPAPPIEVVKSEKGVISSHVSSSGISYAYYIPPSANINSPTMLLLDPHGDGNLPVEKYKVLADRFNFILMGSNDSKNGINFDQSTAIVSSMKDESISFLNASKDKIFIAGFSGGSKAALVAAGTLDGFSGVVYCGAALPNNSIQLKCPSLGFAGLKDMNYTEVKDFLAPDKNKIVNSTIVEWPGKHEWPDSAYFKDAFYWASFLLMQKNKMNKDERMISEFNQYKLHQIANEKNLLSKDEQIGEAKEMLGGLTSTKQYESLMVKLRSNSQFQIARKKQAMILELENQKKNEIVEAYKYKDFDWWKKYIAQLSADKNNASNQRLIAYISLVSWSYSTKALADNDPFFAQKALMIYKLADPENAEQPFLQARLFAKKGNPDSSIFYLNESFKLGNKDKSKYLNEADLVSIRGRADFNELLSRMK